MLLQNISGEVIMPISLIFARIGAALSLFPALGSNHLSTNGRLVLAIFTSIVVFPVLAPYMPQHTMTYGEFIILISMEILFGLILSVAAKICFGALDVVGSIISMQSGLAAANFFDPNQGEQIALMSNFLILTGYMMIFATDTHYLFFEAIIDSYNVFAVGSFPNIGDLSDFISTVMNQSFILAFKLASPFIAVSIGFLITNGVLSRLMPNLQVFFVVTPVQIFVMFIIFFIVINLLMGKFIEAIRAAIHFKEII